MQDPLQFPLMREHIEGLMKSSDEGAFLVVTIKGQEDFIQLIGLSAGVQLDFPLILARQKVMEQSFRETAKKQGLSVIEAEGSDGSQFLDIEIEGAPSEVSQIAAAFIAEFLDVTDDSDLEFKAEY